MLIGASPRMWARVSYLYGLLVVCGMAYVLLDMPIQVTDGYTNMVSLGGRPLLRGVYEEFYQAAYLRPFLWGLQHAVFVIADGRYFEWFRGWHVAQVLVLVVLFIRLLRPQTAVDAAVVPVGLAVLIGMHTFGGTVREAFPINTFMTVVLCAAAAAAIALGPPRLWCDAAAVLLFVFAALTVESGLLVWVVFAAAYLAGARGVSRWGLGTLTVLFAGYFYLRFGVLHVGGPGLIERSSGFGFSGRDPDELIEMFGSNPWPFYAYNVVTSGLSVLLSEPRGGVWGLTRALVQGDEVPRFVQINVVASLLSTAVIARFIWLRRAAWRARRFERADQLVFIFVVLLAANAAVCYPYTKDVVMSPAGVFYALAVAVAARHLLATVSGRQAVVVAALLLVLSATWGVRAMGMQMAVRHSGMAMRAEWAYVDQWLEREGKEPQDAATLRLQQQLQDDAIMKHPGRPVLTGDWLEWFETE